MNKFSVFSFRVLQCVMCGLLLVSCEKAIYDEESVVGGVESGKTDSKSTGNVVFRVTEFTGYRQVPFGMSDESNRIFTRAMTDLTTYCTRLNFVVYKDGKKVEGRSQMKEDSGFGEVSMSLQPGTYKLLVLAHSSVGGNPVVSDPENIHFTNALGYSDTFSFYGDLEVTNESKTHDIVLTRNVSCLRFEVKDEFPSNVTYMNFYYTGGSGVLNAVTGYGGLVNSQQEKLVNVSTYTGGLTFNIYTFLQQDEATLNLTVTALESDKKTIVFQRTFEDIPMKYQMITEYSGYFFDSNNSFSITADTDWGEPYWQDEY